MNANPSGMERTLLPVIESEPAGRAARAEMVLDALTALGALVLAATSAARIVLLYERDVRGLLVVSYIMAVLTALGGLRLLHHLRLTREGRRLAHGALLEALTELGAVAVAVAGLIRIVALLRHDARGLRATEYALLVLAASGGARLSFHLVHGRGRRAA